MILTDSDTLATQSMAPRKSKIRLPEKVKIHKLWLRGMTRTDIAKETGRSISAVCRWVNRWTHDSHCRTEQFCENLGVESALSCVQNKTNTGHLQNQCKSIFLIPFVNEAKLKYNALIYNSPWYYENRYLSCISQMYLQQIFHSHELLYYKHLKRNLKISKKLYNEC